MTGLEGRDYWSVTCISPRLSMLVLVLSVIT
jgi:hypothetical protein